MRSHIPPSGDKMEAIGFMETCGRVGAIVATDTALKSANVNLISLKRVSGGLVIVIIEGEVAAVNEAINAAKKQLQRISCGLLTNVIPRPDKITVELIEKVRKHTQSVMEDPGRD
jgi:microcompartment protein CcmL/EutN